MMKSRNKILIAAGALLLALGIAFFAYVSDYYKADVAVEAVATQSRMRTEGNLTILTPTAPNGAGLIFYPGAKVEETAYLPLLNGMCQQGVTCVLVKMPFRLAFFNVNAADKVYEALPEIEDWYIGGHSLGGAMASSYAAKHPEDVAGVLLLGAYVYGDVPAEKTLTVYGSEDRILDRSKVDATAPVVVIEGGNHAYFGNYGQQNGDGAAVISREAQQALTVAAILEMIG